MVCNNLIVPQVGQQQAAIVGSHITKCSNAATLMRQWRRQRERAEAESVAVASAETEAQHHLNCH